MLEIDYQELFKKIKNIVKKRLLDKYIKDLIQYEASTSSKPGGQHMQRKHTKIKAKFKLSELEKILLKKFDIELTTNQKLLLKEKDKYLISIAEDYRSQFENKKLATERLLNKIYDLLNEIFPVPKLQSMQEPYEAEEKRIKEKKNRSQIKLLRRKIKNITEIPEEQS
ncbi:MAG: aminoacyl-tRNA hydrolase [Candidatus Parcubacteria bacterium]|nr:MAG: aminoacyl-tRNA hydrolase [Candidatus Parcubacteria bacterium]